MTTHDSTVLAAHLGTTHLAESLTAAIDPAKPQRATVTVNTYDTANDAFAAFCEHVIARNPKGATMTTADPAAEVARLAAETEGARVYYACNNCEFVLWVSDGTEGDTGTQCGHDPQGITGPYYYFPPAKPAPPTSRETLAANVKRLREAKGWNSGELSDVAYPHAEGTYATVQAAWIDRVERCLNNVITTPDDLDALAKALDTTPAALLTPQETDA